MFLKTNQVRKYAFNSIEFRRDPHQMWSRLLADGPVIRSRITLMGKVWLATSWDAANDVLRNQDQFARDGRRAGKKSVAGMPFWMPKMVRKLACNMLTYDGKEHRRLRKLVDQAFLKSNVEATRPRLEFLADKILDDLEKDYQSSGHSVDLVTGFAKKLPLAIICEILGLPDEDRPKFSKWFRGFADVRSAFSILGMFPALSRLIRYMEFQFEELKKNPREGLLSELASIEVEGDQLTREEFSSMGLLLLAAGHETTVHLISNAVRCLLNHPKQKHQLLDDWGLASSAIDEVLRYASPVQFTKPRIVVNDNEFYGQALKRGELVLPVLGSANHDPNKFETPNQFDIARTPNPHLTFGSGIHICLGLKLAKAETEVALQRLFTRFPNLSLAIDDAEIDWAKRLGMQAMRSLPIQLG